MASSTSSSRCVTIRKFYAELTEPKELVVIDGADHLFDGQTSELGEAVEDLLRDWPQ